MNSSVAVRIRRIVGWRAQRLTLAIGFTAVLALSAGMVAAAIPNSNTGVINGCFEKHTGLLRVIDVQAGKQCTRWETPISWSQAGPPGAAGAQGLQGERGADGTAGAEGPAGPQGERGLQGEPGSQGERGLQGEAGQAGADGKPGADGAPGPQGPVGENGSAGATGPQGLQGDAGAGVVWRGDFETGPGVGDYAVGSLVRYAGSIWMAPVAIDGGCRFMGGGVVTCPPRPGDEGSAWQLFAQDGPEGPAGPQGIAGPQGQQGPQGPQGGAPGPQGPQGAPGGVAGYEIVRTWVEQGDYPAFGLIATCPAGKRVVGGGHYVHGGNASGSGPVLGRPGHIDGDGWVVEVVWDLTPGAFVSVEAICANVS